MVFRVGQVEISVFASHSSRGSRLVFRLAALLPFIGFRMVVIVLLKTTSFHSSVPNVGMTLQLCEDLLLPYIWG
jgi:hypothetical protein